MERPAISVNIDDVEHNGSSDVGAAILEINWRGDNRPIRVVGFVVNGCSIALRSFASVNSSHPNENMLSMMHAGNFEPFIVINYPEHIFFKFHQ